MPSCAIHVRPTQLHENCSSTPTTDCNSDSASLKACRDVVSWCWESPNYNYSVYMWQYETEIVSEGHGFVSVRKPHV